MTVQGPTVVRRQLGSRLRRLREDAGKTIQSVSGAKIFSTSKMIRIEGGKIEVKAGDVWTLCRFYGMTDPAVIDDLAVLADGTGERGWWQEYGDRVPDWFALYLDLEQGADEVLSWHPELVPGLLQIDEYAMHVLAAAGVAEVKQAVELRQARQQRFFEHGKIFKVVLSPAVLLREVGSARVMATQRQHLLDRVRASQAEIRLLPWSVGAHRATSGGFTVFHFQSEGSPSAVYLESLLGGRYFEGDDELAGYRSAFDSLWPKSVPLERQKL